MNKIAAPIFIALLVLVTAACTEATSSIDLIEPGDMVNDMVIVKSDLQSALEGETLLEHYCWEEFDVNKVEITCEADHGDFLFLNCLGITEYTTEDLDVRWEKTPWELTIDGETVDLPEFGPVEQPSYYQPGKIVRVWGVAIENLTAGTHKIVCKETFEGAATVTVNIFVTVSE